MSISRDMHPPALDAGSDGEGEEIPSALLEIKAYVADRRNDTSAVTYSSCGREIQVSFFAIPPPRVSYLCVFCRPAATGEDDVEMIHMDPEVLATDENLVLLRIIFSHEKDRDIIYGNDLYVYRLAGDGGPSLTLLRRPPGGILFNCYQVGILSCPANLDAPQQDKSYMVAALCTDRFALGRGRFVLYLYNSKLMNWTVSNVSVEDQHFQKYQDEGFFVYRITKVIAVGGEDATVAFVDLWRGILLCDLSHVKDKPWLRYVPLPGPPGSAEFNDARLSRDIAVVKGHFRFVLHQLWWKNCRTCCREQYIEDGWKATIWTRPVSASSLVDDSWEHVCDMESDKMDIKSCPDFQLLPKLKDNEGRPLSPFKRLHVSLPTLIGNADDTVCFMVKINHGDAKAWVVVVDVMSNRLLGVAEFDAHRYIIIGFAYLHSRISQYLKRAPGTLF